MLVSLNPLNDNTIINGTISTIYLINAANKLFSTENVKQANVEQS